MNASDFSETPDSVEPHARLANGAVVRTNPRHTRLLFSMATICFMAAAAACIAEGADDPSEVKYVCGTTGSDSTGDGSAEQPWATIGHAFTEAGFKDGAELRIRGGVYVESVTNSTASAGGGRQNVTIRGGYGANW